MAGFIQDFGLLFLVIVLFSFIVKLFRQPIIIGYVLAGLLFSLRVAYTSVSAEQIIMLSELGITFLLFLMGLEFDFKNLKYLGKDIIVSTVLQSVLFFGIGFGITVVFGFSYMAAVYIGILFMFSSTLLVAKWLEDKKETTTLHGKITLGTLILQDVIAIIALTILGVVQSNSFIKIILAPVEGIALLLIMFIFARYILNHMLKVAIKYPELLFIFALGVCFLFVEISPMLGYSETIGAFLAGIVLANTAYKNEVHGKLKPLIIFFNMLFFVGLGFQMNVPLTMKMVLFIGTILFLSLFVKPLVVYLTLKIRGYDMKTAFLCGLGLSQLSEFAIIITGAGVISGLISVEISAIAIISVILSMILSSYLIKYDKLIYKLFEPKLKKIDWMFKTKEFNIHNTDITKYDIIFFGYYEIGKDIYKRLIDMGKKVLVVENDPANIEIMKKEEIPYIYNSVSNPDFFEHMNFEKTELIVSSIIDLNENKRIIEELKKANPKAVAIVTAKGLKDSLELYSNKADYVIYPFYLNEQHVSLLLEDYTTDINKLITKKVQDMEKLKEMEKRRLARQNSGFMNIDRIFSNSYETIPADKQPNIFTDIDSFFKNIAKKKAGPERLSEQQK